MFCGQCGNKFDENANFCASCGKVRADKKESVIASGEYSYAKMHLSKKKFFIVILFTISVIIGIVWFVHGGNSLHDENSLRGTWVDRTGSTIEFSRRNFSINLSEEWHSAPQWERDYMRIFLPQEAISQNNMQGTYTITGYNMELVYRDGQILSRRFALSRDGHLIVFGPLNMQVSFVRHTPVVTTFAPSSDGIDWDSWSCCGSVNTMLVCPIRGDMGYVCDNIAPHLQAEMDAYYGGELSQHVMPEMPEMPDVADPFDFDYVAHQTPAPAADPEMDSEDDPVVMDEQPASPLWGHEDMWAAFRYLAETFNEANCCGREASIISDCGNYGLPMCNELAEQVSEHFAY